MCSKTSSSRVRLQKRALAFMPYGLFLLLRWSSARCFKFLNVTICCRNWRPVSLIRMSILSGMKIWLFQSLIQIFQSSWWVLEFVSLSIKKKLLLPPAFVLRHVRTSIVPTFLTIVATVLLDEWMIWKPSSGRTILSLHVRMIQMMPFIYIQRCVLSSAD